MTEAEWGMTLSEFLLHRGWVRRKGLSGWMKKRWFKPPLSAQYFSTREALEREGI